MLRALRDLGIVWGIVGDTPILKAERELHRTDMQLLEAEGMAEEFCAKATLLRGRIRRLEGRESDGDLLDSRVKRGAARARLELLEVEAQAEEMCARVKMLRDRLERLRPLAYQGAAPAPSVKVSLSDLDHIAQVLRSDSPRAA
jgi:hypothetical protein